MAVTVVCYQRNGGCWFSLRFCSSWALSNA